MKRLAFPLSLVFALSFVACDEETSDSDSGNDGGTAADGADGGSGDGSGDEASMEDSSMETCMSSHECINDVCTCTTPGMEDEPCTDNEKCEDECEVCM